MPLVKISRKYQVTLPAELRQDFQLKEGDYLEVSVQNGAFVFKPVRVVEIKNEPELPKEKKKNL